jgi:hypothetical protein
LRIVLVMYTGDEAEVAEGVESVEGDEARDRIPVPMAAGMALAGSVLFTLVAGVLPGRFIEFARAATLLF